MVDDWTPEEWRLYEEAVKTYLYTLVENAEAKGRGWYHYQFYDRKRGWCLLDIACEVAF